jgi:hypothetical protein
MSEEKVVRSLNKSNLSEFLNDRGSFVKDTFPRIVPSQIKVRDDIYYSLDQDEYDLTEFILVGSESLFGVVEHDMDLGEFSFYIVVVLPLPYKPCAGKVLLNLPSFPYRIKVVCDDSKITKLDSEKVNFSVDLSDIKRFENLGVYNELFLSSELMEMEMKFEDDMKEYYRDCIKDPDNFTFLEFVKDGFSLIK